MNGKQLVWCWMLMFCACVLFDGVLGSDSKFTGLHPPSWTLSEIVTPVRLEKGDTHKGERHFQKRSVTFSEEQEARNTGQSAQYRVEAFGEQFILDLDHDASFLSPSFNVHVSGESTLDIHDEDNSIHCFYSGHVNGHPESSAVVSLCGGMFGLFHTHNGTQFYIEPEGGISHGVETNTKPHIVYSSGPPSHPSSTPSPAGGCGVIDDNAVKAPPSVSKPDGLASQVYGLIQSIQNSLKWKESEEDEEDSTRPHHRGKRFISYERYLEMMVVADHKMVEHHGQGVQLYVLTLVAVVNRIFRDPSIGNAINVTLVELRILQNVNDGPHISSNAPITLKNFCNWQQQQNEVEDSHPRHYDTAVLLTREDICRSGPDCDTLGLAELGTVCDPLRSCSIVEDNGLSAAFTMAHELGHVFNLLHDSNFKCQSDIVAGKYAVMAPTLNYHSSPWKWSKCSRNQLTEFLDLGYGECLLDKPTGSRALPASHPGEVYNITQQCELVFGTGSTLCTYMRTCKRLWCTGYSRGVQTGCRTQHMPWADGTPCGSHHWCARGECREKDPHAEVIDGQWGKWGEYSECSRTCGGGVKEASRNCDNPAPENGGKYCIGRRLRFRSCNTQDCPEGSVDFREKQCSEFNGSNPPINGVPPNVRWVPKYEGVQLHDRCKLYCRVSHSSAYYELKKKVIDGTKCDPDTDDICVQGQCRQAGCDHILSSNAKRDECGVCGGDNSSCRRERRTYNDVRHGYTKIITIPTGATQIEIKQYSFNGRAEDDNYLALSNDQDQFILNGHFIVSMYAREIHINKTVLQYSGSSRVVETIVSNDKLQRAINLYILSVGDLNPPNVSYSFNVPHANFPIYLWDRSGPWSECDRDCYGMKRRAIRCMDANDNRVVDDSMCQGPRPTNHIEEECNTRCIVRWHVMSESECNTECKKTRLIKCIKKKRKGEEYMQVSDEFCNDAERPPETVVCQNCRTNHYRWEYSLWSQCSRSCNTGTKTRGASCRYGEGYIVDNRYCDPSSLHTVEDCNTHACPEWSALRWSACSVTCGVGEEHREVACYQEGVKVDSRLCDSLSKPDVRRRCEQQRCPHWAPGQWNSCSVSCGSGYQQRTVRCRTFNGQWLDESECSAGAKPITEQECNLPDCPIPTTTTTVAPTTTEAPAPPSREIVTMPVFDEIVDRGNPGISPTATRRIFRSQWRTGAWTPCSKTCGPGIRERYVSCRDNYGNIDSSDCDPDSRPPSMEMCEIKSCPHWRTGDWRECPVSCGEGVTTRYVACVYNDDTITSNSECDPDTKPSREHTCHSQDCPTSRPRGRTSHDNYDNRIGTRYSWRTSTWSSCSVSCGEGLRQRRVECLDDGNRISSYCDQNSRPPDTEPCEVEPCPSWDYGEWGQCSQSCGGGVKSRVVKCRRRDGQTVSDSWCDQRKPEDSTACNTQRCQARWHTGPYSTCSVTCGKGQKTRIVVCRYEDGSLAMDSECEEDAKPISKRECKKPSCAKWKSGKWGECSVTCGRGIQERDVVCISHNRQVNETLCPRDVPRTSKGCRRPTCPTYRWKKGRWSQCNETCGGGLKFREVWCQENKGRRVSDEYCQATRKRPTHKRKCNIDPCPPRYNPGAFWVEGLWGECTRTCGAGEQTREITCQALSGDGWRIPADISSCNPSTKPEATRRCNMGTCFGDVHWKTGPWNSCSKSCGDGVQRRKVQCQARHGKIMPDRFCRHPAIKPETERICNSRPCPPTSCKDLQEIQNIEEDGDYSMLIQGRLLHIFCHGMAGSNPAEYLTLPASEAENYSEIYPKRLLNPSYCPNNGARNDNCACTNYGHRSPGLTSFNKIRINITTLEVITDDPTFATVHHGHFIPYATAGDCFSAVPCPQGRFHVSLNGTGLVVAPEVDWSTEGHSVSRQISRDAINQRVSGICGGYCGKCFPDRGEGRLLPLTFQS